MAAVEGEEDLEEMERIEVRADGRPSGHLPSGYRRRN